jgi:predicted nucleic acid-binding protein
VVIIDTNILVIEFRHQHDERYPINNQFLSAIRTTGGATTVYTLMEFLGKMSFNMNRSKLTRWRSWLRDAYNLVIIWPEVQNLYTDNFLYSLIYEHPFERMRRKPIPFVDALILDLAEQLEETEALVTWNTKHFEGNTFLTIKIPKEFLASGHPLC